MGRLATLVVAVLVGPLLVAPTAQAGESKEQAQLAEALKDAKVSLEKGLAAAAREGKPISAKFEIGDDGKLQLSIYTAKDDKFSEVIVDHQTGQAAKVDPITGGEDLAAAKLQAEAMAKANLSLENAVFQAVYADRGYRAVSVYPSLRNGRAVADVTLQKGSEWKTVSWKLN
ncbi:MAG: hypothetical protein DMD82_11775 [Candidatus Rokuibacteriota bacterium]|nr:MAG: hypothetical protein DMD82_11775 [Candidatus Rokubacteria bacterium]